MIWKSSERALENSARGTNSHRTCLCYRASFCVWEANIWFLTLINSKRFNNPCPSRTTEVIWGFTIDNNERLYFCRQSFPYLYHFTGSFHICMTILMSHFQQTLPAQYNAVYHALFIRFTQPNQMITIILRSIKCVISRAAPVTLP